MHRKILVTSLTTAMLAASTALVAAADAVKAPEVIALDEPLQIVVSLDRQHLQVFRGTEIVAESPISSGKPGHSTPTGIFSILGKKKFHRSNIYSNAPMPWMQRLTWSGIALHESDHVPDYPASHGCVRMPGQFARDLFKETALGEHVVITGEQVTPQPLVSMDLPQPKGAAPYDPLKDQWRILIENAGVTITKNPAPRISTAALLWPVRDKIGFAREVTGAPLRILITRRSRQEITADIQSLLNRQGYDAGAVDGLIGPDTWGAVKRFQEDKGLKADGTITPEFTRALFASAGMKEPSAGRIFVMKDSHAILDAPIDIDQPDLPLGTHLITSTRFDRKARHTEWLAMTLESQLPDFTRAYFAIDADAPNEVAAADALSRIHIPEALKLRIERELTPGSSISISDTGQMHTGWTSYYDIQTHLGQRV